MYGGCGCGSIGSGQSGGVATTKVLPPPAVDKVLFTAVDNNGVEAAIVVVGVLLFQAPPEYRKASTSESSQNTSPFNSFVEC